LSALLREILYINN